MADEPIGRRRVLQGAVALLSVLPGCGNVFIEEPTPTPDERGPTPAPTQTPAPTPADTPTPAPTPTAALPSNRLEIRRSAFSLRLDRFESAVYVDFEVRIENVSRRVLEFVEYRVDVRYDAPELSRTVATDYFSRRFPEGLEAGETARLTGTAKFVRDGRAERSTDEDDFALEFAFREVDFR
ncbi:hypothetical protein [Salinirarus marinus]|uniref:hypothetical protein n=1 Tax=Salinirarus marinus TaxID=3068310 RepID=UPI003C6C2D96